MESHLRLVVGLVLELLHDLEELRDHVPVNLRRVLPLPRLRFGLGSCAPLLLGLRLNWRRNCRNFSLLRSLLRVLALGCSLGGCLVVSLSWSALGFRLWLLLLLLVVLCFLPCSLLSLLLFCPHSELLRRKSSSSAAAGASRDASASAITGQGATLGGGREETSSRSSASGKGSVSNMSAGEPQVNAS